MALTKEDVTRWALAAGELTRVARDALAATVAQRLHHQQRQAHPGTPVPASIRLATLAVLDEVPRVLAEQRAQLDLVDEVTQVARHLAYQLEDLLAEDERAAQQQADRAASAAAGTAP